MAKVLTEKEVADTGGTTTSNPTLCCTAARAGALNCNVTSPSSAASNQLITGVSKKSTTPSYDYKVALTNYTSKSCPGIDFLISGATAGTICSSGWGKGSRTFELNWSKDGIVNGISMSGNTSYIGYVTISMGETTVLSKKYIGNAASQTYSLTSSFHNSACTGGRTVTVTFSDS